MINRCEEVRNLMKLSPQKVIRKAGDTLVVCNDLDILYLRFAEAIVQEIQQNNEREKPSRFIFPIGPTGQYPLLAEFLNTNEIQLDECWFFFMDEYCDKNGFALNRNHPLSFKGIADNIFFKLLDDDLGLNMNHVFFPDENNISKLKSIITKVGGIDVCYGGIGIHGHVAFNEPENGVNTSDPRKVALNNFTITINSIRAEVGGNLETFPNEAYTLGMNQILKAKKIRLYCRNGTPYDWANTVLRIALLANPGDDYPVTYIRDHPDYAITTDWDTLRTPKNII
ncbi:MAG: hypothetical protein GF317_09595 [Candidatus Lokiarchaeota archaeon]|nr:hypothetical protein [Candidatus Lokiarchaeota archaeon]MBD3199963.1 hypothetical protein [Candidatus Lokiarchaeota archaeon]